MAQAGQGQSIVHGSAHRLVHFTAVAEPHLNFGRVHVHIHTGRVDGDEQHVNSLALPVQDIVIGAAHPMPNDFVAHKAAVDISELLVGSCPRCVRCAGKAMHPQGTGTVVHPHRIGHKRLTQHVRQAQGNRLWATVGTPLGDCFSLVPY